MKLCDIIITDAMQPQMVATSRNEAIGELVEKLVDTGAVGSEISAKVIKAVVTRENKATTGIGKGVAIPHASLDCVDKPIATIGLSTDGIDFNSLDNKPVYAVVLLVSNKDKPEEHLDAMEALFSRIKDDRFRKLLFQSRSTDALIDLIEEADTDEK